MLSATDLTVARFFFGVAVLAVAYGVMYRRMKVDRFREDLFTLRDEVFDYMWKNDLPYDHPAYVVMRTNLNGAIRFSERLTIPVFVLMARHASRTSAQHSHFLKAVSTLDQKHQQYFVGVRHRVRDRMMEFLFLEGLCGFAAKCMRTCWKLIGRSGGTLSKFMSSFADSFQDELTLVGSSKSAIGRRLFGH